MYKHTYQKRVRYGETDQMGYLYYGNYALYYEIGRVEALRSVGIQYKNLEKEHGIMLPVVKMEARYVKPALYDDLLQIETSIKEMPGRLIHFHFRILNENQVLINKGEVVLSFVNMETGKVVIVPEGIRSKLAPYFDQ